MAQRIQLPVIPEPSILMVGNRSFVYKDFKWQEETDSAVDGTPQVADLIEGEGLMFQTSDGAKWLFTPPETFERMPEVIYMGSITIR